MIPFDASTLINEIARWALIMAIGLGLQSCQTRETAQPSTTGSYQGVSTEHPGIVTDQDTLLSFTVMSVQFDPGSCRRFTIKTRFRSLPPITVEHITLGEDQLFVYQDLSVTDRWYAIAGDGKRRVFQQAASLSGLLDRDRTFREDPIDDKLPAQLMTDTTSVKVYGLMQIPNIHYLLRCRSYQYTGDTTEDRESVCSQSQSLHSLACAEGGAICPNGENPTFTGSRTTPNPGGGFTSRVTYKCAGDK